MPVMTINWILLCEYPAEAYVIHGYDFDILNIASPKRRFYFGVFSFQTIFFTHPLKNSREYSLGFAYHQLISTAQYFDSQSSYIFVAFPSNQYYYLKLSPISLCTITLHLLISSNIPSVEIISHPIIFINPKSSFDILQFSNPQIVELLY
jgi:hypothetical protein